jgi:hypothetical protein
MFGRSEFSISRRIRRSEDFEGELTLSETIDDKGLIYFTTLKHSDYP